MFRQMHLDGEESKDERQSHKRRKTNMKREYAITVHYDINREKERMIGIR